MSNNESEITKHEIEPETIKQPQRINSNKDKSVIHLDEKEILQKDFQYEIISSKTKKENICRYPSPIRNSKTCLIPKAKSERSTNIQIIPEPTTQQPSLLLEEIDISLINASNTQTTFIKKNKSRADSSLINSNYSKHFDPFGFFEYEEEYFPKAESLPLMQKKAQLEKEYEIKNDSLNIYTTAVLFCNNSKKRQFKKSKFILNKKELLILPSKILEATILQSKNESNLPMNTNSGKAALKPSNIKMLYAPLCVLNFDQITAQIAIEASKHLMIIYVLGSDKQFHIKFQTKEILTVFTHHTINVINNSFGSQINLLGVSLRPDFERNHYISEHNFHQTARTGDCLMFKGFQLLSKVQRCCTRAEYDHVALLWKKGHSLYVYESTSRDGAKVRNWTEFIGWNWNLLYDKMVLRRIIVDLDGDEKVKKIKEIETKCTTFIEETQGKKYQLKLCTALCGDKPKDYEANHQWSKSPGFFCSQLVIAAYINSGIVPDDRSSGSFLPGCFGQDKPLKLSDNLYLSQEMIIDFTI